MKASWPKVRLGEVLRQAERAEAVDPSKLYQLLGVRWYGQGLFLREEKLGANIAANRLYLVKPGDFVYNRLFAWKGSFAVADAEASKAYVSISSGRLHFDNSKRVDERYFKALSPQRVPMRGDILYSAVGATLGIPAVVDTDEPFCFQRHVAILKPIRGLLDSQYACHMLRPRTVFDRAWASTTGSAQPTVPLRAIRELQIPVPSLEDQRWIASELGHLQAEMDGLCRLQAEASTEITTLLPAVLYRAFKGEL